MEAADSLLAELERVYRESLSRFLRVATAVTGDSSLARDAVNDAFVNCIRGGSRFRGESPVEAWVWRAVLNSALRVRERNPEVASVVVPHVDNGHSRPELSSVRVALASLPERQRLVVFLRYYADLSYREIAETLGITAGTVGATLSAAHAFLRPRLEKELTE